jgi:hypothetical protein
VAEGSCQCGERLGEPRGPFKLLSQSCPWLTALTLPSRALLSGGHVVQTYQGLASQPKGQTRGWLVEGPGAAVVAGLGTTAQGGILKPCNDRSCHLPGRKAGEKGLSAQCQCGAKVGTLSCSGTPACPTCPEGPVKCKPRSSPSCIRAVGHGQLSQPLLPGPFT